MAVSFFNVETKKPTMILFENSLDVNEFRLWRKLLGNMNAVYPNITTEWEYLSRKFGWFLVFKSDDDVLFYVVPDEYCFRINFIFDEAMIEAVKFSNLPKDLIEHVQAAEKTDRGYSFYRMVKDTKDIEIIEVLTQFQYEMRLKEKKESQKKKK